MDVAVTGSSGLIGTALREALAGRGDRVVRVVRSAASGDDEVRWDPTGGRIEAGGLEGIGAVVHLAGEPLFPPWTRGRKQRILDSREAGTRLLATTLAGLDDPPEVLVSQSAIGFYPHDAGDRPLTEASAGGAGFLAAVVRRWEAAARPAADAGIRVVHPRTGLVLAGGAPFLRLQALPARLGLGAKLGDGRQWQSWIHLEDEVGALLLLLDDGRAVGPVDLTAPEPVRQEEFADTLARVLRRPRALAVPRPVIRAALGRTATEEFALADQRVLPHRLTTELGYRFRYPDLEAALRAALGRPR